MEQILFFIFWKTVYSHNFLEPSLCNNFLTKTHLEHWLFNSRGFCLDTSPHGRSILRMNDTNAENCNLYTIVWLFQFRNEKIICEKTLNNFSIFTVFKNNPNKTKSKQTKKQTLNKLMCMAYFNLRSCICSIHCVLFCFFSFSCCLQL